jgi:hypothetical protein
MDCHHQCSQTWNSNSNHEHCLEQPHPSLFRTAGDSKNM